MLQNLHKRLEFAIIPLLFVILICSLLNEFHAYASYIDLGCTGGVKIRISLLNCCRLVINDNTHIATENQCQLCATDLDAPEKASVCGPWTTGEQPPGRPQKSPPPVITTEPPSVAPPKVCPDGSSPDANGQCPPTIQAPTDQGTTLPPTNDNNNPKHKGSNLGQLGGSLLNNNNSPSSQTTDNTPPKHHKGGKNALQVPPTDQGPS
jgi:hypothetical protein